MDFLTIYETEPKDLVQNIFKDLLNRDPSDVEKNYFIQLTKEYDNLYAVVALASHYKKPLTTLKNIDVWALLLDKFQIKDIECFRYFLTVTQTFSSQQDLLNFYASKGMPMFVVNDQLSFNPIVNPNIKNKVCVISLPKCGTYFFRDFLEYSGFIPTSIHVGADQECHDCRYTQFTLKHEKIHFPLFLKTVHPSQFFVSHLEFSKETKKLLTDFKIIFLYRDIRKILPSFTRWIEKTTTFHPSYTEIGWFNAWVNMHKSWIQEKTFSNKVKGYFKTQNGQYWIQKMPKIIPWIEEENVLAINFDDVRTRKKNIISKISQFLTIPENVCKNSIEKTLNKKSITFIKNNNENFEYDDELELIFQPLIKENQKLGFEQ